ncbi:hypothetical protein [Novosphingobium sp. AP12]|uniref:hypothetical protein n=1 Tax=Novosphingobium sp. AP12 TaxID=1144305 RepID=UPI0002E47225|nr:hypothetical protein [Novosphingobium sp. AP12]
MTSPRKHRAGPRAKAIYGLIFAMSIVLIWAAVRSCDTAPQADSEQLLPADETRDKQ